MQNPQDPHSQCEGLYSLCASTDHQGPYAPETLAVFTELEVRFHKGFIETGYYVAQTGLKLSTLLPTTLMLLDHSPRAGTAGTSAALGLHQRVLTVYPRLWSPESQLPRKDFLPQCHLQNSCHLFWGFMAALWPLVKPKIIKRRAKKFTRHQSDWYMNIK